MTIRAALQAVLDDYAVNEKSSIRDAATRIGHLLAMLDPDAELASVTAATLLAYASARRKAGRSTATVNREVAMLRRACTLAGEPWPARGWRKLRESPPREGFLEPDELPRILSHLPAVEANIVRVYHATGWRKREVLGLRWEWVFFGEREVRLPAAVTKTRQKRVMPMNVALLAALEAQLDLRREDCPFVFHRNGRPVRWFYDSWKNACESAGCPGRLIHDFRRTVARDLVKAGVDRKTAMQMLGHKTESIFTRYQIVNGQDLRDAAAKFQKYRDSQR